MSRRVKFMLVVVVLAIGGFGWWRWVSQPMNRASRATQVVVIRKGEKVDDIGKQLQELKLIRSAIAFKLVVFAQGLGQKIQAGDFRLSQNMDLAEVAASLTKGTLDMWVTFPEGWRREQMTQKLAQEFNKRGKQFDTAAFLAATAGKEGHLFPDTYLIPQDATAGSVITLLSDTFMKKMKPLLAKSREGLTDAEVITLASIVEREASGATDRQLVADILMKRLKAHIGLNVDATLQYIMASRTCQVSKAECANWWPVPTAADKSLQSPFNTYKYVGLPPQPIANPGVEAVMAVVSAQDTPYLFYLHDSQGVIHPAKTIEEQTANIRQYILP